ncbi:MAG: hypothetical protein ACSLFN_06585 [Candidatus Limnocylindrales bacterium]
MSSHRLRRVVGVLSSSMLLFLLLAPATVTAADTRDILVNSPGALNGVLTFTPTSPGGLTAVDVTVKNNGGQTINSIRLLGGTAADDAPVNPLFPAPSGPSLPSGAAYVEVFPQGSAPDCDLADGATAATLTCDIGTLRAGRSVTYRIIIDTPTVTAPATGGTYPAWFGVYVAEGNATGTNQDNFYASGSIVTATPTCSANENQNKNANYFLPNESVSLTTSSCNESNNVQQTGKIETNAVGAQGTYAETSITGLGSLCSTIGYTCYGSAVTAEVLDGQTVADGVQWTIRWYGTRSMAGVIHFWDSYVAGDATYGDDYTVIPFTKKSQCSAKLTTNCWVSTAASKGNVTPSWFEAVFRTPNNGRAGGWT